MVTNTIATVASYFGAIRGVAPLYVDAHESPTGLVSGGGSGPEQFYSNGLWYIGRPLWIFDQRDIEPQKVVSARIKFYPFKWANAPGVDYIMQIGLPDYPHYPPVSEDYDYFHYYGDKLAFHDSDVAINVSGQFLYVSLDPTWVRLGEFTKLMLRTSDDIAGNAVSNRTQLHIEGHTIVFETEPPTLEVTYEVGAPPLPPPNICPEYRFPWWWIVVAGLAGTGLGYAWAKRKRRELKR